MTSISTNKVHHHWCFSKGHYTSPTHKQETHGPIKLFEWPQVFKPNLTSLHSPWGKEHDAAEKLLKGSAGHQASQLTASPTVESTRDDFHYCLNEKRHVMYPQPLRLEIQ